LAAYGIGEVRTSPWQRCRATVKHYTRAAGLKRLNVPALSEQAARTEPACAAAAMRQAFGAGKAVVVCSHRPVLGLLLKVITGRAESKGRVRRQIPQRDPWLRPAELLVAHVAGTPGRVLGVETHRAPPGISENPR
jgi:8-oxo-dGTP diphosphatase